MDIIKNITDKLKDFNYTSKEIEEFPWYNEIFKSSFYKWCHLEHYKNNKIEVFHCVLMPNCTSNMPIFGIDIVYINGKNTMICCDFTPTTGNYEVQRPIKNKRKLPDWADFFSDNVLLTTPNKEEREYIINYYLYQFHIYLNTLHKSRYIEEPSKVIAKQNDYIINQRKNTSTIKALSAHIGKKEADRFIKTYLFPDIEMTDKEKSVQSIFDFGRSISKKTKEIHKEAESTDLSIDMIKGTISKQNYANYLYAQIQIFSNLGDMDYIKDILRLIENDYSNLNVKENIRRKDALEHYINYIQNQNNKGRKGHIYTLALGHCYGGKFIAKRLNYPKRHLEEIPDEYIYIIREDTYQCSLEDVKKSFTEITKIYNEIYEKS